MDNIWMHILILIPIEFGLLHATPLGPMLAGFFHNMFAGLGFEFAQAAAHGAGEAAAQMGADAASSCGIPGCSFHGGEAAAAFSGAAASPVPVPGVIPPELANLPVLGQ